ncbi:MAG: carboxypeptidase-like regulatory domain-containing protein, partial [Terriglobia bacterium]
MQSKKLLAGMAQTLRQMNSAIFAVSAALAMRCPGTWAQSDAGLALGKAADPAGEAISRATTRCRRLLLSIGLMLAVFMVNPSSQLRAQEFRASVTGQVADTNGAVIPGATITAVNAETRVAASTKTNGDGSYSLLYLLPGNYTVTVAAPNFQTMVYNSVRLDSAQQLGLNVTLKPGSVTQQVVVTAGAVDLDTVSATTGGVIDQLKVENMPSAGLMVFDDVLLTQGIISTDFGQMFNLTPRNNSSTYSAAGEQNDENAFYVNGAPVSDQGSWYFTPSQAAVQQLQASSMPYDAQYGRTGGGAFNTNIKDGTNAYHGAVYDYYGNAALNANTWVNDLTGIRKPINTRNTWGAQSGGPIRKDKTFYFASYEQFLQHEPGTNKDTVPTTGATGEASGDFTGTGFTIYDPTSTYCVTKNSSGGCTTYGRKEFPNDTIPPGDISSIGKAILALYPAPNNSAVTDNYVVTWPTRYGYTQYIGRVDQNFSQNTRMYGIFLYQYDNEATAGNGFTNVAWTGANDTGTDYNGVLDLTHIFSPSMVMDLKTSYGRDSTLNVTGDATTQDFTASKVGLTNPAVGT